MKSLKGLHDFETLNDRRLFSDLREVGSSGVCAGESPSTALSEQTSPYKRRVV